MPRKPTISEQVETPIERKAMVTNMLDFSACIANGYFDELPALVATMENMFTSPETVKDAFPQQADLVNSYVFKTLLSKTAVTIDTLLEIYNDEKITKMMENINRGVSGVLSDEVLRNFLITGILGICLNMFDSGSIKGKPVSFIDKDFLLNLSILVVDKCNLILVQSDLDFEDGTGGDSLLLFFLNKQRLSSLGLQYR